MHKWNNISINKGAKPQMTTELKPTSKTTFKAPEQPLTLSQRYKDKMLSFTATLTGHEIEYQETENFMEVVTCLYKPTLKGNQTIAFIYLKEVNQVTLHHIEGEAEPVITHKFTDYNKCFDYLLQSLITYIFNNYKTINYTQIHNPPAPPIIYKPTKYKGETPTWYKEAPKNAN